MYREAMFNWNQRPKQTAETEGGCILGAIGFARRNAQCLCIFQLV
jgi:hypothetical protein